MNFVCNHWDTKVVSSATKTIFQFNVGQFQGGRLLIIVLARDNKIKHHSISFPHYIYTLR